MLPSRSRGGDPAPAAIERTAGCCSGGSLSIPAAPPPHGGEGDPRPALAVGAVRDAPAGVDIQGGGSRLHKHGIPVEVSRPTAADGFEEGSVARDWYHPLPRHPSLIREQMGSGQEAAFCLPVMNGMVMSAPAGGACGGRDAYDHGKAPSLLLLLAATELPAKMERYVISGFGETKQVAGSLRRSLYTKVTPATATYGEMIKEASVARYWSRLPLSIVRACLFSLVLLPLCAGGSSSPILTNEFTMEFCPLNTSETCSVPPFHPFERPIPIQSTWLTEQLLETRSQRIMLEDPKHKCNDTQSLDFQIISMEAPIISFVANFAHSINVYGIGQVNERGKQLFATSSLLISASNFLWSLYQQKQDCPNGFMITILLLAGLVHLVYALFFCLSSDVIGWSLPFIFLGLSASATGIWNKSTASILGLICMAIGHFIRVAAIRRYHLANVILALFGLLGVLPVFYRRNWETHPLFMISTLISSASRFIDLGMQIYYYRRAPDAAHVPPIVAPNVEGEIGDDEATHDAAIPEGGEDAAHVPPLDQGSNQLHDAPIVAPNVGGKVGDDKAPRDVAIAEGGVSHNCPAGALGVQDIDQEDGNGGALEVAADAQVAVIQNAPASAGAPDVEVAAAADAK